VRIRGRRGRAPPTAWGARPPGLVCPLGNETVFIPAEPHRRFRFSRDGEGKVTALETLDAQTGSARLARRGE